MRIVHFKQFLAFRKGLFKFLIRQVGIGYFFLYSGRIGIIRVQFQQFLVGLNGIFPLSNLGIPVTHFLQNIHSVSRHTQFLDKGCRIIHTAVFISGVYKRSGNIFQCFGLDFRTDIGMGNIVIGKFFDVVYHAHKIHNGICVVIGISTCQTEIRPPQFVHGFVIAGRILILKHIFIQPCRFVQFHDGNFPGIAGTRGEIIFRQLHICFRCVAAFRKLIQQLAKNCFRFIPLIHLFIQVPLVVQGIIQ